MTGKLSSIDDRVQTDCARDGSRLSEQFINRTWAHYRLFSAIKVAWK